MALAGLSKPIAKGPRASLALLQWHLTVPQWWVDMNKRNPSDLGYSLAKVAQIEVGTSNAIQLTSAMLFRRNIYTVCVFSERLNGIFGAKVHVVMTRRKVLTAQSPRAYAITPFRSITWEEK